MSRVILILACIGLANLCLLAIKPRGLPHRQDWELYKQANSPAADKCPEGTLPMYVELDGHEFFEECQSMRGTTNAISQ